MATLLSPPILFFVLGLLAFAFRTGLRIPHPIPKLLSLYLLFAIGFKGGLELSRTGVQVEVALVLLAAVAVSTLIPLYCFFVVRGRTSIANAGAIAATYGSTSAITFITAAAVLSEQNIEFSGYMVAAMALMESPALVVGVLLVRIFSAKEELTGNGRTSIATGSPVWPTEARGRTGDVHWGKLLHESFLNGPVFLLLGSLAVGIITGERGEALLRPFSHDIFTGALCFFLLDLGLMAARRLRDLGKAGPALIIFAIAAPIVNAGIGMGASALLGLGMGDTLLFMVLCGGASYIAAPAALRLVVPQANASLYVPMALGITFPFNVAVGIPVYIAALRYVWPQ